MVQNRYPVALEPDAGRKARGFDGLGRVGALVANETSGRPERTDSQASPGKGGGLWPARSACKLAFAMQI